VKNQPRTPCRFPKSPFGLGTVRQELHKRVGTRTYRFVVHSFFCLNSLTTPHARAIFFPLLSHSSPALLLFVHVSPSFLVLFLSSFPVLLSWNRLWACPVFHDFLVLRRFGPAVRICSASQWDIAKEKFYGTVPLRIVSPTCRPTRKICVEANIRDMVLLRNIDHLSGPCARPCAKCRVWQTGRPCFYLDYS